MINVRQEHILKTLLREAKGLTVEDISYKFDVSIRTVRDDIKSIDIFLNKNGHYIQYNSAEKMYYINHAERKEIEKYFSKYEMNSDWKPVEANQRELYILFILIRYNKSYITTEGIADELFISKTAIANDVKKVSKWIYKVVHKKVNSSKANGIMIDLKESEIRTLISSAIYRNYSSDSKYCMNLIKHLTDKLGKKDIFILFNNIISEYLYNKNIILDYESNITLVLELILFVYRIGNEKFIEEKVENYNTYMDFPFTEIEKATAIKIPQNERAYIQKVFELKESLSNDRRIVVNPIIEKICWEYIDVIEKEMGAAFNNMTADLYNRWEKYLEMSLYKKKLHYKDDEYIPGKMKDNYKNLYRLIKPLGEIVYKYTGMELEEKDYIYNAIYLELMELVYKDKLNVIIVSRYAPVVLLSLNKQLKEQFHQRINVLSYCAINQLAYFEKKYREEGVKIDFIIATHTVKTESEAAIEYISVPITDSDIEKINNYF